MKIGKIAKVVVISTVLVGTLSAQSANAQYMMTKYEVDLLQCSRIVDTQYSDFPGAMSMNTNYEIGSEKQWLDVFNGCMLSKGYQVKS